LGGGGRKRGIITVRTAKGNRRKGRVVSWKCGGILVSKKRGERWCQTGREKMVGNGGNRRDAVNKKYSTCGYVRSKTVAGGICKPFGDTGRET